MVHAPLIFSRNLTYSFSQCIDDKLYLLRCTDGEFRGRFLYINRTEGGELFGSANPEHYEQITMYIEEAGLSPFHAQITYADLNGNPLYSSE